MMLKKLAISIVATGAFIIGSGAQASTYHFGTLTSGSDPAPSPVHFADLTIVDSNADGNWEFSLSALGLNAIFGNGAFISGLHVVSGTGVGTQPTSVSGVSGGSTVNLLTNNTGGGGLSYDYRFIFGPALANRLTDGETVNWVANNMGTFSSFSDGQLALHMQGITSYPGTSSAWYISPVPEPETYAMLLVGLGLMGFSARRRKV